jgi:hypothetical protein
VCLHLTVADERSLAAIPGVTVVPHAVVGSTAQLEEAVVDHLPKIPPSQVDKSEGGVTC